MKTATHKGLLSLVLCLALILGLCAAPVYAESEKELYELTIMANLKTELNDLDKAYLKGIEEALNLKINMELPPASNYGERLQMMLASADYPDLTLFTSLTSTVLRDACKDGVFIPLNDYLADCPNIMEYTYDISWEVLRLFLQDGDDSIYGIPRTSIARTDGFAIRTDWLDNLGYTDFTEDEPMTLDQLVEILRMFTFDDPDGNGIDDTYGFGTYADGNGNIGPLFGSTFGLAGWVVTDDEIYHTTYSREHTNYYDALAFTRYLWEEGLIDPDAPTIASDVAKDRYFQGISGVRGEFAGWTTDYQQQMRDINPEVDLGYITTVVQNPGDTYTSGAFSNGVWGLWTVAHTAKEPARILEMLDYMLSDDYWSDSNYGPEGIAWNEVDGVIIPTEQYTQDLIGRNMMRRNNDPGFFVSLAQSPENRARIEKLIDICIKQFTFSPDYSYRPAVQDDPTYIDYDKHRAVQVTKIIVGDLPLEEWWNVLDGWYAAGGQQYMDEMTAFIREQNSK